MNVLLLSRQRRCGIATLASTVREGLDRFGETVRLEDASDWMPANTQPATSKAVSEHLVEAAKGTEIVIAFGYRCAWACAEAFGRRKPWLYIAYDKPKTTRPELIRQLNLAKRGICCSNAVRSTLQDAHALNLTRIHPGVWYNLQPISKASARDAFGIGADDKLIVSLGPHNQDELELLVETAKNLKSAVPKSRMIITCDKLSKTTDGLENLGWIDDPGLLLRAADLFLDVGSATWSMSALEAMRQSTPVLLRDAEGLDEIISNNQTGFLFQSDMTLQNLLTSLLQQPSLTESIGEKGKIHAQSSFDAAEMIRQMIELAR